MHSSQHRGLKKNILLYKVLRISLCNKGGFSSCSGDCFCTVLVCQTVKISSYIQFFKLCWKLLCIYKNGNRFLFSQKYWLTVLVRNIDVAAQIRHHIIICSKQNLYFRSWLKTFEKLWWRYLWVSFVLWQGIWSS